MNKCTLELVANITDSNQQLNYIRENCNSDYKIVSFVELYFGLLNESAYLFLLVFFILLSIAFVHMSIIADNYLSISMRKLAKILGLSPSISAVTITAFSSGAPDIISSIANASKSGGTKIGLGIMLGSFIFSSTMVIANVLFNSKSPLKLEKYPIIKEIIFYGAALIVIFIFGMIKRINYVFVAIFIALYIAYIYTTVKMEELRITNLDEVSEEEEDVLILQSTNEFHEHYEIDSSKESDFNELEKPKSIKKKIMKELNDERHLVFFNVISIPIKLFGFLVIPYFKNTFLKTRLRFLIYFLMSFYLFESLFYFCLTIPYVFMISIIMGLFFCISDMFLNQTKIQKNFFVFMTIVISVLTLKIYVFFIIDCISFLSFVFTVDQLILSAILLSVGNSLGDYFSNGALAHQGEIAMATIACFSNQTFNILIGFNANIIMGLAQGKVHFDIFGIDFIQEGKRGSTLFMIALFLVCILILVLHFTHYWENDFHLDKHFADSLVVSYLVFFVLSLIFGIIPQLF